jgi:hypothetical protein
MSNSVYKTVVLVLFVPYRRTAHSGHPRPLPLPRNPLLQKLSSTSEAYAGAHHSSQGEHLPNVLEVLSETLV